MVKTCVSSTILLPQQLLLQHLGLERVGRALALGLRHLPIECCPLLAPQLFDRCYLPLSLFILEELTIIFIILYLVFCILLMNSNNIISCCSCHGCIDHFNILMSFHVIN